MDRSVYMDMKIKLTQLILTSTLALWAHTGAQATVIGLSSGTGFQNEGTLSADHTALLSAVDGSWGPVPTGSVSESYYATGTGTNFFDAISLNFDLSPVGFDQITSAVLRFYTQKGDYATVDRKAPYSTARNAWEHYQVLPGAFNPTNQDVGPFSAAGSVDFGTGTLAPNTTVGWLEAGIDTAWITSDSFDVTLRLWNVRIDAVELSVATRSVPEPSTLAALLLGLLGVGASHRRSLCSAA
jgi:hypothetical protein